jgi:hypothetical protein
MSDIRLFQYSSSQVVKLPNKSAGIERWLQELIESHMEAFLGVRFLETEFPIHEGRIDSLGLDENGCPVIIEYKRYSSETIINQGLRYLNWLDDRKADFRLLVMEKLGKEVASNIKWEGRRLLCIAADFTINDESILLNTNRDVELLRYELFGDDFLLFELANSSHAAQRRAERVNRQTKTFVSPASVTEATHTQKILADLVRAAQEPNAREPYWAGIPNAPKRIHQSNAIYWLLALGYTKPHEVMPSLSLVTQVAVNEFGLSPGNNLEVGRARRLLRESGLRMAGTGVESERGQAACPRAGTITGQVWDIASEITKKKNVQATRKEVIERCEQQGINKNTAQTQYGKWKAHHDALKAGKS